MERRRFLQASAAAGALVWTAPTVTRVGSAAADGTARPCTDGSVIFADNFDDDGCDSPTGNGVCTHPVAGPLINWEVISGNVDTIDHGSFGSCQTPPGRTVDMQGTENGTIRKRGGIDVFAGRSYLLTYSLGRNHNSGNSDSLKADLGDATHTILAPTTDNTCVTPSLVYQPLTDGNVDLTFAHVGQTDSSGCLLDDVVVTEYCTPGGAASAASAP